MTIDPSKWVDIYGDILYRFAYFRVKDTAASEDLVQETFLAALKAKDSFAGESSEKSWLIGILKHKITDYFRSHSFEKKVKSINDIATSDPFQFDENGMWINPPAKWDYQPDNAAEQSEFFKTLANCLDKLPDRLKHAFVLSEIDEIKTKEICRVLGISSTNVWVMLHRARVRLRECLEKNWF